MYPSASVFCIIGQFRRLVRQRKIPPVRVKRPKHAVPPFQTNFPMPSLYIDLT